jgi:hypothetical protein
VVAALGPTGRGKSTLCAALGGPVLTDDCVLLESSPQGYTLLPTYSGLRLLPDSLAQLADSDEEWTSVAHYSPKRRRPGHGAPPSRHPLTPLVFLGPPATEASLHRLAPKDAFLALSQSTFALDFTPMHTAARFKLTSDLAEGILCHELRYPRDYAALPKVRDLVLELVRETSP